MIPRNRNLKPNPHKAETYGNPSREFLLKKQESYGLGLNIISWKHSIKWIDIFLLVLLVSVTITVTALYVSHEHYFYSWDYGGYQGVAISQAYYLLKSPLNEIRLLKASIALDYNYLFAIPLIPFILLFGSSRLSYVVGVELVYQMPFALVTGVLATRLIQGKKRAIFWSTVFLVLLTPIVWVPVLRGYPDTGSILFLALAVLVYLQDIELDHTWQIGLIGFLIAAAIIYRRHFAYSGIAFYESMSVITLSYFAVKMRQTQQWSWKVIFIGAAKIGLTGIVSLITLFILGKHILVNMLTMNYAALYSSYRILPISTFQYFLSNFGWITWLLVIAGYSAGLFLRILSRPAAYFLLLLGGLSLFQWVFFVQQTGVQYTLQIDLFVVLGLVAFFWTFWSVLRGKLRPLSSFASAFLALNFLVTLSPISLPSPLLPLFSAPYPPLVRSDYKEVVRLIDYLRRVVPPGEPIYDADSSKTLNYDIIRLGEEKLYGWGENKLNLLFTPQIDSRDFYPLEQLLQSDYVIVTTPFQHHLPLGDQKVTQVVFTAFTQNWEISQDYQLLPERFNFVNNASLRIYRRIRPTSLETAIRTFIAMQAYIGVRPGGQPDWMLISQPSPYTIKKNSDNTSKIKMNIKPAMPETTSAYLLYAGKLAGLNTLVGTISVQDKRCPGISLGFNTYTEQAQITNSYEQRFKPSSEVIPFSFELNGAGASYLVAFVNSVNKKPGRNCTVKLIWTLAKE
jgi:hypothetical protein